MLADKDCPRWWWPGAGRGPRAAFHQGLRQRRNFPSFSNHRQLRQAAEGRQRGERDQNERAEGCPRRVVDHREARKRGHAGSGQLKRQRIKALLHVQSIRCSSVPLHGDLLPPRPRPRHHGGIREGTGPTGDDALVRRNVTSGPQVELGDAVKPDLGCRLMTGHDSIGWRPSRPGQDGAS